VKSAAHKKSSATANGTWYEKKCSAINDLAVARVRKELFSPESELGESWSQGGSGWLLGRYKWCLPASLTSI
jgi:hypothetical protein